jgi:class 3 adenylate cyclase/predicted ATPase
MTCPRCQTENRPQAKFCLECAAPLAARCANCGTRLPAPAKFCLECAHPVGEVPGGPPRFAATDIYTPKHLAEKILTSRSALEGERKQVTVLFADLKGSMELLADRDPEEAHRVLDPVLERMMEAVHYFEGTISQVMGDGIMALFGAPLAHEDHAVRACYAALRMQESVRRYAEDARHTSGVPIKIRVGLNSGEVVVRSIGSDLHMDYTAVGQTTHLAARMEQAAPPGSILMPADMLSLAEGYVQVKPLGPRLVKGLGKPIEVYEIVGATTVRSRFGAATARGLTRFVGRDRELEELHRALECAGSGHGQVVAVVGEPGVGKSRLFWEFTHSTWTQGWLIVESSTVSYGKATAYLRIIELLKAYFQIERHDDARQIRDKVSGKLLSLDAEGLGSALPAFLWLLDVPVEDAQWERLDPPRRRQRTLDSVGQLLLLESRVRPLLVLFENLHWLDAEAQTLLDSLVESLPAGRLLLLVNYRPGYQHGWGSRPYYRQLRIETLAPESAEVLLESLVGNDASLQPIKRLLIERTEGHPLFLEECVRALVDAHVVVGEPGQYRLARLAPTIQVPATVQAILASRIDRLAPEHKRLLQAASVVGRHVPFALLKAIAEESEDALRLGLKELQLAELLYETSVFPEVEYTFKHGLTHDVAYGSLLHDRRRRLHIQIMEEIEHLYPHWVTEQVDRLAHHAFKGEMWEKATDYLLRAGQKSIRRSAYPEALTHLSAGLGALARLPTTPDRLRTELDLQVSLGSAYLATRGWAAPEVERTYARARELCDAVGHTPQLFPVLWGITTFYLLRCQVERAVGAAERFLALAQDAEDDGPRVVGEFLMGNTLFWTGDLARTRRHLETSLALYDPPRHEGLADFYGQDIRVTALSYLGWTLWFQGHPDRGLRCHDDAVRLATERNHVHSIAYAEGVRLFGLQIRGAVHELLERAATAIAFTDDQGAEFFSAFDRVPRGWAVAQQGNAQKGIAEMRRALDAYRATGSELPAVAMRSMLADACWQAGQPEHALAEVTLALDMVDRFQDRVWEPEVYRLKGECLLALPDGNEEEAEACFRQAIDLARSQGARSWELRATMSLSRWLRKRGQPELARDALAPVYASFTEGFDTADLRDARALLVEIRGEVSLH